MNLIIWLIVGGVIGWLGFHKLDGFREAFPIYGPMHVAFYIAHAVQEHFAIHTNGKLANAGSNAVPAVNGKKVD